MKFDYTTVASTDSNGKLIKRPMIELELMGVNKNINAYRSY
jgi:hypothetical protein